MALINDIIKKYETEANQKIMSRNQQSYANDREDIFLKVQTRGDPIGEDRAFGLGTGSIWKAQKVKLNPPAKILTQEEIQQQKSPMEQELEQLRQENEELKQKLAELQVNYA